jgi:hypothetical protein
VKAKRARTALSQVLQMPQGETSVVLITSGERGL